MTFYNRVLHGLADMIDNAVHDIATALSELSQSSSQPDYGCKQQTKSPPKYVTPAPADEDLVPLNLFYDENFTCSVCFDRSKQVCFDCGHLVCGECSEALALCPFCKKEITQKIKLYMS
jgi:Zinc finger, C3HC4 type (RING finger)